MCLSLTIYVKHLSFLYYIYYLLFSWYIYYPLNWYFEISVLYDKLVTPQ